MRVAALDPAPARVFHRRMPPDLRMTDVAARAGVSVATVSRALRGSPGVSEPTRQRIRTLAAQLDYVVSPEAAGLGGGSTGRVGVLLHDLSSWYSGRVTEGLERELRSAGVDLVVRGVDVAADREAFFDRLPLRRRVDALVVIGVPLRGAERSRLAAAGLPTTSVGTLDPEVPSIGIDDRLAARQAVNHLLALGHRRIALLNTVAMDGTTWPAHRDRERGYRDALEDAGVGVEEDLVVSWSAGVRGGAGGMDRLLSGSTLPTAVYAFSDEVALGALRSLRRAGLDAPDQCSVVGTDDHPMAELVDLTTVRQDPCALGRAAGRTVLAQLDGKPPPRVPDAVTATHLVVRATTAPPAG